MEQLLKDCTSKLKMHSSAYPNGKCVLWTGCKNKKAMASFATEIPVMHYQQVKGQEQHTK